MSFAPLEMVIGQSCFRRALVVPRLPFSPNPLVPQPDKAVALTLTAAAGSRNSRAWQRLQEA